MKNYYWGFLLFSVMSFSQVVIETKNVVINDTHMFVQKRFEINDSIFINEYIGSYMIKQCKKRGINPKITENKSFKIQMDGNLRRYIYMLMKSNKLILLNLV